MPQPWPLRQYRLS